LYITSFFIGYISYNIDILLLSCYYICVIMSNQHNPEIKPTASTIRKIPAGAALAGTLFAGGLAVGNQYGELANKRKQVTALEKQAANRNKLEYRVSRLAEAVSALSNVDKDTVMGIGLISPADLPAHGQEVSRELRGNLEQATVKILKRHRGSDEPWQPNCTGVKVNAGGNLYVTTAAHCFSDDLTNGLKGGGGELPLQTFNINTITKFEYALTPVTPTSTNTPVRIEAVSQNINGQDWALLRPSPDHASESNSFFTDIKALDFASSLDPSPGQEVALYGAPQANNHLGVRATGIYLGRIVDPYNTARKVDLVGIDNIDEPRLDACNYGASGSSAIFADGYVSGPLSTRNHITYGPGKPQNAPDNPVVGEQNRLAYEQALGVDLGGFATVCGFSVVEQDTIQQLEKGFNYSFQQALDSIAATAKK
jgi:hypothetical protein